MFKSNHIPLHYAIYHETIQNNLVEQYSLANLAKSLGLDSTTEIESPLAFDLADRVAKLLNIPIADRIRELMGEQRTELVALILAKEVASGKYPLPESQNQAEAAVRIGLAIVTDGLTVAPIQGVSAVRTKRNRNDSEYLSVEFAGPMRSAGGTESAFTLVIADQVRKTLGLEKYNPSSLGDEVGRFVEELRIYERDVGNFQYKVADQDVKKAIENLPVEIDGVWTDNFEVVVHRDLQRISTNRVRGGALRVLNDGIVGKSKKLLKLLSELGIVDWKWLGELSGGKQQGNDETKANLSHFDEVISGRPVLSMPGRSGGFRLRYGRAFNTGIHAIGVHSCLAALLNYPIVVGTQVKVDMPGKAASIAIVDSIETPIVELADGTVLKVENVEHAISIAPKLKSIIYMGDLLISFGDFLENNTKLVPSPYVEEWWAQDLDVALKKRYSDSSSAEKDLKIEYRKLEHFVKDPLQTFPTLEEAIRISKITAIPLHPKYLLYWDQLSPQEVLELRNGMHLKQSNTSIGTTARASIALKQTLEKLGAEHTQLGENDVIISGQAAQILQICLSLRDNSQSDSERSNVLSEGWNDATELVSKLSGLTIKRKSPVFVGVRVGRPEKAMPRKMRPPVHGLFPVGKSSNQLSRDILLASEKIDLNIELVNLECPQCKTRAITSKCSFCSTDTLLFKTCFQCGKRAEDISETSCGECKGQLRPFSAAKYSLKQELRKAAQRVNYNPQKPLKGVLGLTNELKIPERLEKVLLRQKYDLSVYKDGTIRYDATNLPLTHFRPKQIQTSISKLRELGYEKDTRGEPLHGDDQLLELMMQDIVLPFEAGTFLVSVAKYVDDLLARHYRMEPYYKIESAQDLIGHLIIGLAPHTSVGVIGRIIGYTNAQACFATPFWHSAKRRDCDGDGDSILLLMDVLLNFSKKYLPSMIGGLMDAPLLIQPLILPREVQRQAHHMDIANSYPVEFYEVTEKKSSPLEVLPLIEIIKNRLNTPEQYTNFGFTHDTNAITVKQSRSSYSTLASLMEKLDRQIELAQKIRAVSVDEVVKSVLKTHLLPDIIGNTKAFTAQRFRCKNCGGKFRRMPIRGTCLQCGGELQSNVTRGSVEKYLQLGLRLSAKYNVGEYLRNRFVLAAEELATLFKPEGQQTDISDFGLSDLHTHELEPVTTHDEPSAFQISPEANADVSNNMREIQIVSEIKSRQKSPERRMKREEPDQTTLF